MRIVLWIVLFIVIPAILGFAISFTIELVAKRLPASTPENKTGIFIIRFDKDKKGYALGLKDELERLAYIENRKDFHIKYISNRCIKNGKDGWKDWKQAEKIGKKLNAKAVIFGAVYGGWLFEWVKIIDSGKEYYIQYPVNKISEGLEPGGFSYDTKQVWEILETEKEAL